MSQNTQYTHHPTSQLQLLSSPSPPPPPPPPSPQMVSQESIQVTTSPKRAADDELTISAPRISFSTEFLDENDFISICPNRHPPEKKPDRTTAARNAADFEFLSGNSTSSMTTADELFSEGKMLPFWQTHHSETLNKIALKTSEKNNTSTADNHQVGPAAGEEAAGKNNSMDQDRRISWFLDDDPSPRPPKCTVLWKELLRLRKQRPSTLSPSSSSSSSSSGRSIPETPTTTADDQRKKGVVGSRSSAKKGLERTRSTSSNSIRIRPVVNVPICTHVKSSSLPPLFPIRRSARLETT